MHKKQAFNKIKILLVVVITLLVISCNDNGSDPVTPISGLSLPASINVAPGNSSQTIQSNTSNFFSKLITRSVITDPATDYSTDKVSIYSKDAAKNEVTNVNYLLCIIDKFKYTEMLNQGPYNLVVDFYSCVKKLFPELVNLIDKSEFLIEGTVISTRENNSSPQVISAWLTFASDVKQTTNPAEIKPQLLLEV